MAHSKSKSSSPIKTTDTIEETYFSTYDDENIYNEVVLFCQSKVTIFIKFCDYIYISKNEKIYISISIPNRSNQTIANQC